HFVGRGNEAPTSASPSVASDIGCSHHGGTSFELIEDSVNLPALQLHSFPPELRHDQCLLCSCILKVVHGVPPAKRVEAHLSFTVRQGELNHRRAPSSSPRDEHRRKSRTAPRHLRTPSGSSLQSWTRRTAWRASCRAPSHTSC